MRYFQISEFKCHCCGVASMDMDFLNMLDSLRDAFGRPLRVLSGYRCAAHNRVVSFTGDDGPHTHGLAADLAVYGAPAYELLKLAINQGFNGIGIKQSGGDMGSRFIHLDMMPVGALRPRVWSY